MVDIASNELKWIFSLLKVYLKSRILKLLFSGGLLLNRHLNKSNTLNESEKAFLYGIFEYSTIK